MMKTMRPAHLHGHRKLLKRQLSILVGIDAVKMPRQTWRTTFCFLPRELPVAIGIGPPETLVHARLSFLLEHGRIGLALCSALFRECLHLFAFLRIIGTPLLALRHPFPVAFSGLALQAPCIAPCWPYGDFAPGGSVPEPSAANAGITKNADKNSIFLIFMDVPLRFSRFNDRGGTCRFPFAPCRDRGAVRGVLRQTIVAGATRAALCVRVSPDGVSDSGHADNVPVAPAPGWPAGRARVPPRPVLLAEPPMPVEEQPIRFSYATPFDDQRRSHSCTNCIRAGELAAVISISTTIPKTALFIVTFRLSGYAGRFNQPKPGGLQPHVHCALKTDCFRP